VIRVPTGRMRQRGIGLALVVAGAAALFACSGSSDGAPSPAASARHPDSIDRAIIGVNGARRELATAMDRIVVAANRVDSLDRAAATGKDERFRDVRRRGPVDPTEVDALVGDVPAQVTAYATALDALSAATQHSDVRPRQVSAVRQVVAIGRSEANADSQFARAVELSWPVYATLVGKQSLWYDRASTGWYRGSDEAASAYAVLIAPDRPATDHASQVFATADRTRRDAAETYAATLDALRPILGTVPAPQPSVR
jgi:hypothetical protein